MNTDQPSLAVTRQSVIDAFDLDQHYGPREIESLFAAVARTNSEPRPAGDLREAGNEIGSWEENVEFLLAKCPHTIRGHEGDGPENLIVSLVLTFGRMQHLLATHSPAPMAGGGWQDIASAPKDGRDALVGCWVANHDEPERPPVWSAWETVFDGGPLGCDGAWGDPPTHWHDMPAPPAAAHPSTQEGGDRG